MIAKEKAEESNRLKTAFLNNISHEFRTPLNGIMGFSDFLINENISVEKKKQFVEIIKTSGNRLLEIVTNTLEIAHIQSNTLIIHSKTFRVYNLLMEIYSVQKNFADKKKIDFRIYVDDNIKDLEIETDYDKFYSSLKNIIENAIKFTTEGVIEIICKTTKDLLQINVSDTGIGISPELQEHIFEPYRQTETSITRNYGGLGLGLALVKGYIEKLNGKIDLYSEPNKGTKITLYLPLGNQKNEEKNLSTDTFKKTNFNKNIVLIVDDEEINYLYLNELLSKIGIKNILYKRNGEEAVELFKSENAVSLVLMDIKMPIMDGIEATKIIKEINSDVKIVAQTAYATNEDFEKFRNAGFDGIITKPFKKADLLNYIS